MSEGPQLLPGLAMVHARAARLEPVVVALAELAGERMDAPVEVREVAEHVKARIAGLAATKDPWVTDPGAIPTTASTATGAPPPSPTPPRAGALRGRPAPAPRRAARRSRG